LNVTFKKFLDRLDSTAHRFGLFDGTDTVFRRISDPDGYAGAGRYRELIGKIGAF
jgi:hypothetical protein